MILNTFNLEFNLYALVIVVLNIFKFKLKFIHISIIILNISLMIFLTYFKKFPFSSLDILCFSSNILSFS